MALWCVVVVGCGCGCENGDNLIHKFLPNDDDVAILYLLIKFIKVIVMCSVCSSFGSSQSPDPQLFTHYSSGWAALVRLISALSLLKFLNHSSYFV